MAEATRFTAKVTANSTRPEATRALSATPLDSPYFWAMLPAIDAPPVSSDAVRAAEEADEEGGARLIHDEAERSQFTARVSAASPVKAGQPITLTVNCEAMHAFDPATGDSIGAKTLATAAG